MLSAAHLGFAHRLWMLSSRIFIYVVNGVLLKSYIATGSLASLLVVALCAFFFGWLASTTITDANREAAERAANAADDVKAWYVTREDLKEFQQRVDGEAPVPPGTTAWHPMLEKDIVGRVQYKAKRRNVPGKMTEYLSTTIIPGATAEEMCDFSLDDPYRCQWEGFMKVTQLLEQGRPPAGLAERQQVVRYVRQFPFNFISKREYVIARSVFREGDALYAICKGIDHPGAKAAAAASGTSGVVRVGHYSSCWRFRTVLDPWGGTAAACEMLLLHCEDMRIPDNLARVAIRVGMLGYVREMIAAVPSFLVSRRARAGPTQDDPEAYSLRAPLTDEALRHESQGATCNANGSSSSSHGNIGGCSSSGRRSAWAWRDRRRRGLELAGHKALLLRPKGGALGRLRLRHALSKSSSGDSWIINHEGSQSSNADGGDSSSRAAAGDRKINQAVEAAAAAAATPPHTSPPAVSPPPSAFAGSAAVGFAPDVKGGDAGAAVRGEESSAAAAGSPTAVAGDALTMGDADAVVGVRVVAPHGGGGSSSEHVQSRPAVGPASAATAMPPVEGMSLLPSGLASIGEAGSDDVPLKPKHALERLGVAAAVLVVAVLAGQGLSFGRRRRAE